MHVALLGDSKEDSDVKPFNERYVPLDRIVIDTVISKYCNHTPLHRQSMILGRDIGLEISRATLDGWVLKVGELLIPMVAAMRRALINGGKCPLPQRSRFWLCRLDRRPQTDAVDPKFSLNAGVARVALEAYCQ